MARARLRLLAQAQKDMIELRRYSLREFGKAAADRYVHDMRRVFSLLCDNPGVGKNMVELGVGIRSFSKRSHRIVYRLADDEVQIVRVLHHSRDFPRHLKL